MLLFVDCCLLVVVCSFVRLLFVLLLVCLWSVARFLPCDVCCLLFVGCCLLSVVCFFVRLFIALLV